MKGRRIIDGEWMTLQSQDRIAPGDYGRDRWPGCEEEWVLFFCPPNAMMAVGNWIRTTDHSDHSAVWHDDGTVTVNPSILIGGPTPFHGFLRRGEWVPA